MKRIAPTSLIIGLLATSALTQTAIAPKGRVQHAMAYDVVKKRVILSGGSSRMLEGFFSDTWSWDGKAWSQVKTGTSPKAVLGQAMAFDEAHKQLVLLSGSAVFDTWLRVGENWKQVEPDVSPPERVWHTIAYDSARKRAVLFGGFVQGYLTPLSDTWLWDGTTWTQAQPGTSPGARGWHAMAYDETRSQVVLFGGLAEEECANTWLWDGTNWKAGEPETFPQARIWHAMAYDAERGQVLLFGGSLMPKPNDPSSSDGAKPKPSFSGLSDTWLWDGTTWTQAKSETPPQARSMHAMAYDREQKKVVLFGGMTTPKPTRPSTGGSGKSKLLLSDTWEWDGTEWTKMKPTKARRHQGSINRVVFISNRGDGGTSKIYTSSADGTDTHLLFETALSCSQVSCSRIGDKIAFRGNTEEGGPGEIWIANPDGTNLVRLTNHPADDSRPCWSPDGRRIAFMSKRAGADQIFVVDVDGKNLRQLTRVSGNYDPAWSPDGSKIAFASARDRDFEIYVMDADGNNPVRLTHAPGRDTSPDWAPHGAAIVFSSQRDGNGGIYIMDSDGGSPRQLTRNEAGAGWPAWSPDGKNIAFQSSRDGKSEIYLIAVAGGDPVNWTRSPGSDDVLPAWMLR